MTDPDAAGTAGEGQGPSRAADAPPDAADWLDGDLPTALARLESEMIRRALHAAGNNRAEAARRLGINRQALYEKLRRHGIGDA